MLDPGPLPIGVDLKEDVAIIRRQDEVYRSEGKAKPFHELPASLFHRGRQVMWFVGKLIDTCPSPVMSSFGDSLRVNFNSEHIISDNRDSHFDLLGNFLLQHHGSQSHSTEIETVTGRKGIRVDQ